MNFSKNSKNFFTNRNIKNMMNNKYSGNIINSFLNKMRIKSYLNFSNNIYALRLLNLKDNLMSNFSGLSQITSGQEKLNSEATADSPNLNNLLIMEYTRIFNLMNIGSKIFFFL